MTTDDLRADFRRQFAQELADLLCVPLDKLPTSVPKPEAAKFLGLVNPRTLNVWHCNGRHGIAMLKVGRDTRPMTAWLLDFKAASVSIAEAAA